MRRRGAEGAEGKGRDVRGRERGREDRRDRGEGINGVKMG